jgi:glycosyltransferase involved in cell wall biosynthesis
VEKQQLTKSLSLSVILPVYNEVNTFKEAVEKLVYELDLVQKIDYELIVVESNSPDGTRKLVESLKWQIGYFTIYEDSPLGKGHAVRAGLSQARGDWILIYDADLEYNPNDIHSLVASARTNSFDFIIGSRHSQKSSIRKMPNHKMRALLMNIAHKFFALLINVRIRRRLKDPFSMYKLFKSSLYKNIVFKSNRFDFDWELIIVAGRLGAEFCEIPINYTSRSFAEGKKIRFFFDPLTWILAWFKYSFMPLNYYSYPKANG